MTPEELRKEIDTIRKALKQIEADTKSRIAQMEEGCRIRTNEMLDRLYAIKQQYRQLNHCEHPQDSICHWADAQECLVCGEIIEYQKKQAGVRDFNPLAPIKSLPEDIQEDIKTERGHVTRLRMRRP